MKPRTVIVPLTLPRLSDQAATHLVELLHEILELIEHHYAEQIHRHRRRQREIRPHLSSPPSGFTDPPF
jgi:demethoxyubiquinone hydroxylase (CLK1/Coq7/Cat5 family)